LRGQVDFDQREGGGAPDDGSQDIFSTTTASPWVGDVDSGTSFAAPIVAGAAALLMNADSNLAGWPVAVRAILQATAWNNISGPTTLPTGDDGKDGAGSIDANRAYKAAARWGGTGWDAEPYNCATGSPTNVVTPELPGNRRTRVALAWNTNPSMSATSYPSIPSADLDLVVRGPDNKEVASSRRADNTNELVDFTTGASGIYKVQVEKWYCTLSPGSVGVAWYSRDS
jgi:subtilisin family serine protease